MRNGYPALEAALVVGRFVRSLIVKTDAYIQNR
jgi:hypothetical protein